MKSLSSKQLGLTFLLASTALTNVTVQATTAQVTTAENSPASNPWQQINPSSMAAYALQRPDPANQTALATQEALFSADLSTLSSQLSKNSQKQALQIPLPNGDMATYLFTYQPVMAAALAAKYPDILSFKAVDANNPKNTGSFGISDAGFHGMFIHNGDKVLIDTKTKNSANNYMVYYAKDAVARHTRAPDTFTFVDYLRNNADAAVPNMLKKALARTVVTNQKTTYSIAFSTAGEYTAAVGGTKAAALAEINKMLTRVNEIYQRDLNINFQLADGADQVIFTDASSDPFDNTDSDIYKNNQVIIDAGLKDSVDLAHVLNTGAGGLAYNGVCDDDYKTRAITGSPYPNTDVFYVSYVAHEIGHQLGAQHTFNGTTDACAGDTRNASTAWEVLSGSTIMSYAGICGIDNLTSTNVGSSDFFHIGSIEEIKNYTANVSCGVKMSVNNTPPTANAGADYTIPASTPFKLTGSSSDADGDTLTHIWEQKDVGGVANAYTTPADDGSRPLFRSWEPDSATERYLPRLTDVLNNTLAKGENYATTDRNLNFLFTVRDGKGGVATDEALVKTVNTGRAFSVISPNSTVRWASGGQARIVWDTVHTEKSPISCSQVDVLYSNDDGVSFSSLVTNLDNTGEALITVPSVFSSTARMMLRCSNNIFYNVSQRFSVVSQANATAIDTTPVPTPPTNSTTSSSSTTSASSTSSGSGGGSMPPYMIFLLFGGLLVSAGCQSMANNKINNEVNNNKNGQADEQTTQAKFALANVTADVQQAVAMGDSRLYSMSGRNPVIPGVPIERRAYFKNRCGVRFIAYGGDHIKTDEQGKLRKQAFDYAAAYNQAMIQHCDTL